MKWNRKAIWMDGPNSRARFRKMLLHNRNPLLLFYHHYYHRRRRRHCLCCRRRHHHHHFKLSFIKINLSFSFFYLWCDPQNFTAISVVMVRVFFLFVSFLIFYFWQCSGSSNSIGSTVNSCGKSDVCESPSCWEKFSPKPEDNQASVSTRLSGKAKGPQ